MRRIVILIGIFVMLSLPACAAPQNGSVKAGNATIQQNGRTTTVTQWSEQAIVNWQKFGVSANELIKFVQPNALATLLNRVTGVNPSVILGSIKANGRIFIVNPNGIVFGNGAQVDVGSLLATTLQISDKDFLNGNYSFRQCAGKPLSFIVNKGQIQAADGGWVVLVAPLLDNEGVIIANLGHVTLDATNQSVVNFDGQGLVNYAISSSTNANGDVMISNEALTCAVRHVVNQTGVLQAGNVVATAKGVKLVGAQGLLVNNGTVRANGGTASLNGDQANVQVGNSMVQARGGTANLTGRNVILQDNATVDVSASNGGGTANIGGNLHGAGPLPNAQNTFIGSNASVHADATCNGNGGTVAVWSEKTTQVYGEVSARGGPNGGNGGFIETSSHGRLVVQTTPDAGAPKGKGGTWLLDPENVTIASTTANMSPSGVCPVVYAPVIPNAPSTTIAASQIDSALSSNSVVVETKSCGSACGNIKVCASLCWNSTAAHSLTLEACKNICVNSSITGKNNASGGVLSLQAPNGAVTVSAPITLTNVGFCSNSKTFDSHSTAISTGCAHCLTISPQPVNITASGTVRLGKLNCVGTTTICNGGTLTISSPITLARGCFKQTGVGSVCLGSCIKSLANPIGNPTPCGIRFNSAVMLTGCVTLDTHLGTAMPITFGSTVDGAQNLNLLTNGGTVTLNAVGSTTPLTSLAVCGSALLKGNVATTGTQCYKGAVTLGNSVQLQTTNSDVTFGSSLGSATGPFGLITVTGNGTTVFKGVVGGCCKPLASLCVGRPCAAHGIAAGGACLFNNVTTTGSQTYNGPVSLQGNATLKTGCADVAFNSTLDGAHCLTINAGTGCVTLSRVGSVSPLSSLAVTGATILDGCGVATTGAQTYNSAVTLGNSALLKSCGGTITFKQTLDGAHSLTTCAGTTVFDGVVGQQQRLECLAVGGNACVEKSVVTVNCQKYLDRVNIGSNLSMLSCHGSITFDSTVNGAHCLLVEAPAAVFNGAVGCTSRLKGLKVCGATSIGANICTKGVQQYLGPVTLTGDAVLTTCNGIAVFSGALNGGHNLTVNAGRSCVILCKVGCSSPLQSLTITGPTALNASVTTTGAQTYKSAVTVCKCATLTSHNNSIEFCSSIKGVVGSSNLTINAGSGGSVLLHNVGQCAPLTSLTVTGPTTLNGCIDTTNAQLYSSSVTLGSNAFLRTSCKPITFSSTLNGSHVLTLCGSAVTLGCVGNTTSLTSLNVTGATALGGSKVTTTGCQTYNGPVCLRNCVTLKTTNSPITFNCTVNGAHVLTANTGSAATVFKGSVGCSTPLTCLNVRAAQIGANITTSGHQCYNGAVTLTGDAALETACAPITIGGTLDMNHSLILCSGNGTVTLHCVRSPAAVAPVNLTVNGPTVLNGCVLTCGAQTYNSPVTLGKSIVMQGCENLANGPIVFNSTVDGSHTLSIVNATFNGLVGSQHSLTSLTSCATTIGANITTSGPQCYNLGTKLVGDVVMTTCNHRLTILGALNGNHNLTLDTGCEPITLCKVGNCTPLKSLTVTSGPTTLKSCVTTSGAQTYHSAVTLCGNVTVTSSCAPIAFDSKLNGAHCLTVNAGSKGCVTLHSVGCATSLSSLTVTGPTTLNGNVQTCGKQVYNSPVTLGNSIRLQGCMNPGGGVIFTSTVDGAQALSVFNATFKGAVGCRQPLSSLSSCVTNLGANITTTGNQCYTHGVTLIGDAILTTSNAPINIACPVNGAHSLTLNAGSSTVTLATVGCDLPLKSLTVTGATTLKGCVTTTCAQIYNSAVTLGNGCGSGNPFVLTTTNSPVTFKSTLDSCANCRRALTICAGSGAVTLGTVGGTHALSTLSVTGPTTLNGNVTTCNAQCFKSPVTVGNDVTLTAANCNIVFSKTLDSACHTSHALTACTPNGAVVFNCAVGGITPLSKLIVNNTACIGGNITTVKNQCYNGAVNLNGNATLKTTCAPIAFSSTVNGGHSLTLSAGCGAVTLGAIGQCTPLTSLTVTGPTTFNGCVTTCGRQTYNSASTLATSVKFTTCSSNVTFNSTVDGANALTVSTGSGVTVFNGVVGGVTPLAGLSVGNACIGASIKTTGCQSYGGAVQLTGDATLQATLRGSVTFCSTLNGPHNLTVNGAGGTVTMGNVGCSAPLTSLTVTGPTTLNGCVTTTGAQIYNSPISLHNASCTTTLKTTNSPITFNSTMNSSSGLNVTLNAGSGAVTLCHVGCCLNNLTVTGPTRLNACINTKGTQTYNGPLTIGHQVQVTSQCGNIIFNSTLDSAPCTAKTFATHTGSNGTTVFDGTVGGQTPLGSLHVNSACIGANITTTGCQSYVAINLTSNATLLTGQNGLIVAGSVNGDHNLTLSSGIGALLGPVGCNVPLASLTVNGPVALETNVTTRGAQTYNGASLVGCFCRPCASSNIVLKTTNGAVTFNGTLDSFPSTVASLTVCAGAGNVTFGTVGGTRPLSSLTVTGPTLLNGSVTTTCGQQYNSAVTIGAASTLSSQNSSINFTSTVNGPFSLIVSPATTVSFGGAIGGVTPLTSLTVTVPTTLSVNVTTRGAQQYEGALTLGANDTLMTSNGNVTFDGTVNGAQSLTVSAGNGAVDFVGAIGNVTPLSALSVTGDTTLHSNVTTPGPQTYNGALNLVQNETLTASSVTIDADVNGAFALTIPNGNATLGGTWGTTVPLTSLSVGGPTQLGASITTTGAQSYGGAISLTGGTALTAGSLSLGGAVNGDQALSLVSASPLTLNNAIGNTSPLASLTVNASSLNLDTNVETVGDQTYTPSITLTQNLTLTSSNGVVNFEGTLNGATDLTVDGGASFGGAVGNQTPLNALSVSGATTLNGNVTTSGTQSFGATTLTADATLQGSALTVNGTLNGAHALSVDVPGTIALDGAVGTGTALTALTLTGGTIQVGSAVSTSGSQTFNASTVTTGNTALSSTAGSVSVNGAVNGSGLLSLYTPNGNIGLNGTVTGGSVTVENAQNVTVNNATVSTFNQNAGSGTTTINGQVQTSGNDSITTANIVFPQSSSAIVSSGGNVTLTATAGSIDPASGALVGGQTVTLNASQNVGPLTLAADTLNASVGNALTLTQGSTLTVGTVVAGNSVTLTLTGGNLQIGSLAASTLDLNVLNGAIANVGAGLYGGTANLIAGGSIGVSGAPLLSELTTLNARTGGSLYLQQSSGALTLSTVNAVDGVQVLDNAGKISLGTIDAGNGIQLTSEGQAIVNGAGAGAVNLSSGGNVVLIAGTAGTFADPIGVDVIGGQLRLLGTNSLNGVTAAFVGTVLPGKTVSLVNSAPGIVYFNGKPLAALEFPLLNDLIGTVNQLAVQGVAASNLSLLGPADDDAAGIFELLDDAMGLTEQTVRAQGSRRRHRKNGLIEIVP